MDSRKETIWLTQSQMSNLFETSADNIGLHIKNIFSSGELDEQTTTEEFSLVRKGGNRKVTRRIKHYDLDIIISVGYRVHSKKGIKFRKCASSILKQYLLEGYQMKR